MLSNIQEFIIPIVNMKKIFAFFLALLLLIQSQGFCAFRKSKSGYPGISPTINWNAPLNRGLIYWSMVTQQGGGFLFDITRKYTGTLTNGPTWSGKQRSGGYGSVACDGTDDYVAIGPPTMSGAAGTVSFWLSPTSTINSSLASGPFMNTSNPATTAASIIMRWDDAGVAGALRVYVFDGGYKAVDTTTTTWKAGVWYHVLLTWDSAAFIIYVNGFEESFAAAGALTNPDGTPWVWGASGNGTTVNRFFGGNLDDFRYYNRALSNSEVSKLYQASRNGYQQELIYPKIFWPQPAAAGGAVTSAFPFVGEYSGAGTSTGVGSVTWNG